MTPVVASASALRAEHVPKHGFKRNPMCRMVWWLLLSMMLASHPLPAVDSTPTFGVYREMWTGLNQGASTSLLALTNTTYNPNWPDNPNNGTQILRRFETELNPSRDYFGERLRTFIIPPTDGDYTFWITSDDSSILYLSPDELPGHAVVIARLNGWTTPWNWTAQTTQKSEPVTLKGGHRYYLEAIVQDHVGGSHLTVRWQTPQQGLEEPLDALAGSGTRMIPCDMAASPPGLYRQPTNVTVIEQSRALFAVLSTNRSPMHYQWRMNGINLTDADATKAVYTLANASFPQHDGKLFSCVLSNASGVVTSAVATLTVNPDQSPPLLLQAVNLGATNILLTFSEPLEAASATNLTHYSFSNGLPLLSAQLSGDFQTVILATPSLVFGSNYSVTISGVRDRATTANTIAPNTIASFTATPLLTQSIGQDVPTPVVTSAQDGWDISAAGSGFGSSIDQGCLSFELRSGDFDLATRVESVSLANVWSQAGLMARASLEDNSHFAAIFATPSINGVYFQSRDTSSTAAASKGSFQANPPNTWLRLKRTGNVFSGYASYDGQVWTQLGSATLTLPTQLHVGLAVSSHKVGTPTTAAFRDFGELTGNQMIGQVESPYEIPGPSSRSTPIAISEIMYKPAPRPDTNNVEFVELYNSNPWFQDISGYCLSGDIDFTFPPGTLMAGGSLCVVATDPGAMKRVYGLTNVFGPYMGSLKKSGTIKLRDEQGSILLTVEYDNQHPWPVAAHGTGHSLVLASPTYGERDPRAWTISDVAGGSPGHTESFRPHPLRNVLINEFLAHTDDPELDFVELYNHSNQSVDLSGCILTDDAATNKFLIPAGTTIAARGFLAFDQNTLKFSLNAAGETIYLKNPDASRVLDAVRFQGQENGVASGRSPDGADQFYRLLAKTPGTNNAAARISDVVFNEIMFHPISNDDDDQYVELYNRGNKIVDLTGWRLEEGIQFTFPTNTLLPVDGYLVVANKALHLRSNYANLTPANTLGDFEGKLSRRGERLTLTMPDSVVSTNGLGALETNIIHIVMNDITYGEGGSWGQWADGGGSSLELRNPHSNNRLAMNWADSDETQKAPWTTIEFTGVLDNGDNHDANIGHAQLGLLEQGECLVDDVEVRAGTGANLVMNPGFENGLANWLLQGCFSRSSLAGSGFSSANSLHIRASDTLWTGVNSCQVALNSNGLGAGQTATLRFRARWLRGWPEAILRLNGNWIEAVGRLSVPPNLGTPGVRNSRYASNVGPAISEVCHSPALPAAGQPVIVTARFDDPEGLNNRYLRYRVDPGTSQITLAMRDDGLGGDAVARDGIYSATIAGRPAGTTTPFIIQAWDGMVGFSQFPAVLDDNGPNRECLIRFGEPDPSSSFGVYHFWISQSNVDRWGSLPNLSNESHDATFVNGRRIIYNVQGRFSGSPYHQSLNTPDGNPCHYTWGFPKDDLFLGSKSINKLHLPGNGPGDDPSMQREQLAHTFMRHVGVPWLYRRYVAVYVNGNRRGMLMEDTQRAGAELIEQYFPDDDEGTLYKMQPWFEFAAFPNGTSIEFSKKSFATLMPHTTTGGMKKAARYRYNYLVHQTPDSASHFAPVYSLVDAAGSHSTPGYVGNMENIADMENWMRYFAANHAAGGWDAFGAGTGQNVYGYIGRKDVRYTLIPWDNNLVLGLSSWAPGENLFSTIGEDPNLGKIYQQPVFRRMYWRALEELINGPLDPARSSPLLDAKYEAFTINNLSPEAPGAVKSWIAQARTSISSQLAAENASGFYMSPPAVNQNVAQLTGTAPVDVETILVNGVEYPVTWLNVSTWRVLVPLLPGSNQLAVTGVDRHGRIIPGNSATASAMYAGISISPVGRIVINEILATPTVPDAAFVELHNTSTTQTFDLSNWRFNGLSYSFPPGSLISPGAFLNLAANRTAYAEAYGATTPLFDTFDGGLQADGETLTLIQPGTNTTPDVIVAKVRYDGSAPWPETGHTSGLAWQLIDPDEDNWRAGNWQVMDTNSAPEPKWVHVVQTGTASSSVAYLYLQSAGDVYLDDLTLVAGSVPEIGQNFLANGHFESGFPGSSWMVSPNHAASALSTSIKHSGNASLHLVATSGGSSRGSAIYQDMSPGLVQGAQYTLSYWYRQNTNGGPLTLRLSGSGIVSTVDPGLPPFLTTTATPGAANSTASDLPPFAPVWINEVQPRNLTGLTNRAGQYTAWLELHNPTTNTLSLAGHFLSGNYANLTNWAFPAGTALAPGEFKVIFADGQSALSLPTELHTSFILTPGSGELALSRLNDGKVQVLDYVTYDNVPDDRSWGSFPDAQSFLRQKFFHVTPGGTNNGASAPIEVSINEWLADNSLTLADPADQDFEDWFELFNPGPTPVDLGGYFLTDNLTNKFQFEIPDNGHYQIPPGGYLLVWADDETGQNTTNRTDLHANFKLSKNGEAIGLFAADGTTIDAVSFGQQASDISQGRYPDGAASVTGMGTPTPRQHNIHANSPPQLNDLPNRHLHAGQTLVLTISASDPDQPSQLLTYSLEAAPAGSILNQSSGQFTWNSINANVPSTNLVTARVTDDAVMPLSDTHSFFIIVEAPPQVEAVWTDNDTVRLTFPTLPGQTYQAQYKNRLDDDIWTPLGNVVTGTGGMMILDADQTSHSQCFFRLAAQL